MSVWSRAIAASWGSDQESVRFLQDCSVQNEMLALKNEPVQSMVNDFELTKGNDKYKKYESFPLLA